MLYKKLTLEDMKILQKASFKKGEIKEKFSDSSLVAIMNIYSCNSNETQIICYKFSDLQDEYKEFKNVNKLAKYYGYEVFTKENKEKVYYKDGEFLSTGVLLDTLKDSELIGIAILEKGLVLTWK